MNEWLKERMNDGKKMDVIVIITMMIVIIIIKLI